MKIKPLKKRGLGRLFRKPRLSDFLRDLDEVHLWPADSSLTFTPIFKRPELEPFRPCEVDGEPAVFHRWVEADKALLQMERFMTMKDAEEIKQTFDRCGYAATGTHIEKVRQTFALVEYMDGTVRRVDPEKVKFTDRRASND